MLRTVVADRVRAGSHLYECKESENTMHASHAHQFASNSLRRRYQQIRRATLALTEPFSAEDQMLQSMPDASPAKWHLAHTTWFFETFILGQRGPGYRPFDPRFKHLFNSYYKQLGAHPVRGSRGLMSRPSLEEVHAYRAWVDDAMGHFLENEEVNEGLAALIEVGLNHEQQHQELILTDLKHALWSMPLRPERRKPSARGEHAFPRRSGSTSQAEFTKSATRATVLPSTTKARGMKFYCGLFNWRRGWSPTPSIWNSCATAAIKSRNCGSPTAGTWSAHRAWNSPLYWERTSDGTWLELTFAGMKEVDLSEPVCHVSYYEADAFARWSGARLPREEEWEVAAAQASS